MQPSKALIIPVQTEGITEKAPGGADIGEAAKDSSVFTDVKPLGSNEGSGIREKSANDKSYCGRQSQVNMDASCPPLDSRIGWLGVVSSFLVNAYCFGVTFSWSIYQTEYLSNVFAGEYTTLQVAFVGSLTQATLTFFGVFSDVFIRNFGYRKTMIVGTFFCVASHIVASFATKLWHIFLTQGFLFGLGISLVYFPSISLPAQHFEKKRGVAMGVALSGSGLGGLAFSPLVRFLIDRAGLQWSLRALALLGLIFLPIAVFLARPRVTSTSRRSANGRYINIDFHVINTKLVLLLCCTFFNSFGYNTPYFMLNGYARFIGMNADMAAILTGIMPGINSVGRVVLGLASDYFGCVNTLFLSLFLTGAMAMILWPFASTSGILIVFAVTYGFFGGGYMTVFPTAIARFAAAKDLNSAMGLIYSINTFGYLLGPPIAGFLFDMTHSTSYLPLSEFTGAMIMLAASFVLALRFKVNKNFIDRV
ncbi:uncharacterized protein VTP21DRAFT_5496 [Calcarisporiella thermophila]|uniref:uncharacterized protein n=1 Tax=Calcarisporiella thermophila TaxID=911321 RepID=UPI0037431DC5